jgi:hypothetical protein
MVTLTATVAFGGLFLYLFLLGVALLAGYVVLLVQLRRAAEERATKVRYLTPQTIDLTDHPEPVIAPAYLLRQSAN